MAGLFDDPTNNVGTSPAPVTNTSGGGEGIFGGATGSASGNRVRRGVIVRNDDGDGVFSGGSGSVGTPNEPGVITQDEVGYGPFSDGAPTSVFGGGNTAPAQGITSNQLDINGSDLTSIVNGVRSNTVDIFASRNFVERLEDLSDVVGTATEVNEFLVYDQGTGNWMPRQVGLDLLNDVELGVVEDGDILVYSLTDEAFTPLSNTLANLRDTNIVNPIEGNVLVFTNGQWRASNIVIPTAVINSVSTAMSNHIQLALDENGVLSVTSNIENYVRSAEVSGNTLTLTNDDGTTVAFSPSGAGGTNITVNGQTLIDPIDFTSSTDFLWAVSRTLDGTTITPTILPSIARVAQIFSWALEGNTDFIPDAKIRSDIARVAQIAPWAQTGNTELVPDNKLPGDIARTAQLAQLQSDALQLGTLQRVARISGGRLQFTGDSGSFIIDPNAMGGVSEWDSDVSVSYTVGQVVYIIAEGFFVRTNMDGQSNPQVDFTNWNRIERVDIRQINGLTGGGRARVDIVAGDNVTVTTDAATNTITINATGGGPTPTPEESFFIRLSGNGVTGSGSNYNVGQRTGTITVTATLGVTGEGFNYTRYDQAQITGPTSVSPSAASGTGTTFTFNVPLQTAGTYRVVASISSTNMDGDPVPAHGTAANLRVVPPAARWYAIVQEAQPTAVGQMRDEGPLGNGDESETLNGVTNGIIWVALPDSYGTPIFRTGPGVIDFTTASTFGTNGFTLYNLGSLMDGTLIVEVTR